jgi:hypothetical protein
VKDKKLICFIGIHKYKFAFEAGANHYYECKHCNKRIVTRYHNLYSPIDRKWLRGDK